MNKEIPKLNIGDVVYKVEVAETQYFRPKCRVCGGKKEVTVNGVTFKCPACNNEETVVKVSNYTVVRFRVYSIIQEVGHLDWKPDTNVQIKYGIYTKHGKGHSYSNSSRTETISEGLFSVMFNKPDVSEYLRDKAVFSDYNMAVAFADSLTQKSLNNLKAFNEAHGTDFVPQEFEFKHDKKSK